jgi:hypothetical protein
MSTPLSKTHVKYNGVLLMRGSHAFELYETKQFKELDEHLAKLDKLAKQSKGTGGVPQ